MEIYKILNYDDNSNEFDFIVSEEPVRNYTLMKDGEIVMQAEDNGDGMNFTKKLGKEFDYSGLDDLHLFLNLVEHFDDRLFETYNVMQKVTTV